jgi:hypothetical protein
MQLPISLPKWDTSVPRAQRPDHALGGLNDQETDKKVGAFEGGRMRAHLSCWPHQGYNERAVALVSYTRARRVRRAKKASPQRAAPVSAKVDGSGVAITPPLKVKLWT